MQSFADPCTGDGAPVFPGIHLIQGPEMILEDGERLVYQASWGIFGNAGEIAIETQRENQVGLPQYRVISTAASRGMVRNFYAFESHMETLVDPRWNQLLASVYEGGPARDQTRDMAVFDYLEGEVAYVDYSKPHRSRTTPFPEEPFVDIATSLHVMRTWDIEPGEERHVVLHHDGRFFPLVVRTIGTQTLNTKIGRVPTLIIEPRMEGEPEGFFKRGGHLRIWLTRDERRLPVRIDAKVRIGTAVLNLVEYHAPVSSKSASRP